LQQPTAASVQGGYASTATYGAPVAAAQPSAQQQQQVAWSQQASVQGAQQADHSQGTYGRTSTGVTSLPATGGGSVNSTSQYGGQYGAVYPSQSASQQVLSHHCLVHSLRLKFESFNLSLIEIYVDLQLDTAKNLEQKVEMVVSGYCRGLTFLEDKHTHLLGLQILPCLGLDLKIQGAQTSPRF
jgi:hypothetical protein